MHFKKTIEWKIIREESNRTHLCHMYYKDGYFWDWFVTPITTDEVDETELIYRASSINSSAYAIVDIYLKNDIQWRLRFHDKGNTKYFHSYYKGITL